MKNKYISRCLIVSVLSFIVNIAVAQGHSSLEQNEGSFTVIQIDSLPEAYIVYIKKNTSVYKIVSIKDDARYLCNKISIGSTYSFKLKSWLNRPNKVDGHIRGLHIGGKAIGYIDENIVQNLFYTQNLNGLCYNYSNKDTVNVESLEAVLKKSLLNFRANVKEPNAFVYFSILNKLQTNEIGLSKNDFLLLNKIDPKILKKKENNYFLEILVEVINGETFVTVSRWKLTKKNRKEIILTDLGIRDYFTIIQQKTA